MLFRCFYIILFLSGIGAVKANNLQLTGLQVKDSVHIQVSVSWENSWRLWNINEPYNLDAVWLFAKYRVKDGMWKHLDLSYLSNDHIPTNANIDAVTDGKGVFITRSSAGSGKEQGEVVLKLAAPLPKEAYDLQVFGIEMVWVKDDSFYLGDGVSSTHFRRGDANVPYHVTSENAIPIGKDSSSLNDTGKFVPAGTIPKAYPKGFKAFYIMKYEISQEQYVDFLNCLSYTQQAARVTTSPEAAAGSFAFGPSKVNRNGIVIETPGNAATNTPAVFACNASPNSILNEGDDGQTRACNFLSWADVAAYLDWSGLRPMTELEFERACRGPLKPVAGEFAWGTDKITDANTLSADGTDSEHVTEIPPAGYGLGSHGYSGPQGPLRNGFGGNDSTDRLQIGSGYYGALELSGNLWEMCVTVNSKGLQFTGKHGDGELDAAGNANVQGWPGPDADGTGTRGGGWNSGIFAEFRDLATSDRFYAGQAPVQRRNTFGGRGVRAIY